MNRAAARAPDSASAWASLLRETGFCAIRGVAPSRQIVGLAQELSPRFERTPFSQGLFSGARTKRFHALLKRSVGAADLVTDPLIVAIAEEILLPFCDSLQLNLTQAIEIHPGAGAQFPHRDQDMWHGEKGRTEYLVNVMWPLTRFTRENGGTLLWPFSHRRQQLKSLPEADAVSPQIGPGDALVFLGSTLHGGGANRSPVPRRGIIISYCLGWLKPYENMWLTYPPEIARSFPPDLQALVGYRRHRPNLGNYDGQCPSILFRDDVADYLPASDALAPAQEAHLAAHAAHPAAG